MTGWPPGAWRSGSSNLFETRYNFELFTRDENLQLRTPVSNPDGSFTFDEAIDNFQARFVDFDNDLGISEPINITNVYADRGETISPEGSDVPFTLDLTTRLVDNAFQLTLPEVILPQPVEGEIPADLRGEDDFSDIKFARRLEYIISGEELNALPSNIRELTLIIEDTDPNQPGFQDGDGDTIIAENDIHRALNDINFINDNNLLGFSESNEENAPDKDPNQDVGIVDRVRVSRFIGDDETISSKSDVIKSLAPLAPLAPIGIKALAPLAPIGIKALKFKDAPKSQIISNEQEISFQNSIPREDVSIGQRRILIEAEDLHLDTYHVEHIDIASGGKVISLLNASDHTGTATLDVDKFGIDPGTYALTLGVFDENDGQAQLEVFVNGHAVGDPITLDQNLGSGDPTEETLRNITIGEDIKINSSDVITIQGTADMSEFARVDFLSFIEIDV
ncbi:MAG: hypothetical protein QNJ55_03520 [Xenococcus sp. MO_188.B8]|nr:hypothetical protein [Xenococcus sp. MO_188.B8]